MLGPPVQDGRGRAEGYQVGNGSAGHVVCMGARGKPLCKEIRRILFPLLKDGALFTGTSSDPSEKLYDPITEAFDVAFEFVSNFFGLL